MMTSRWHNEVKRSIRNRNIHKRQSLIDALRNYYNNSISLARNNMKNLSEICLPQISQFLVCP